MSKPSEPMLYEMNISEMENDEGQLLIRTDEGVNLDANIGPEYGTREIGGYFFHDYNLRIRDHVAFAIYNLNGWPTIFGSAENCMELKDGPNRIIIMNGRAEGHGNVNVRIITESVHGFGMTKGHGRLLITTGGV